ncbi:hypothetical protein ODS41_02725 [Pyrobaculum sp. 3827-6]|uniref:hypothetical protein n=1 Tax=Pyrobaculum sp. 3827-6 TaxID=2983604 RepID=UPI0021D98B03|nr:hypothetical protein [Pyrobaculum sp. 3827-6]MCU7786842.1 hypothetical protein [Pyrobaculum sp. 3827-6]
MKKAPGRRGSAAGGAGIRARRKAIARPDRNNSLSQVLSKGREPRAVRLFLGP